MPKNIHLHKTDITDQTSWQDFTDAMLEFAMNRVNQESISDILGSGIEVFSELPGVLSVSLFLLDEETCDFHYSRSVPEIKKKDAEKQFEYCVQRAVIAAALNSGQPASLNSDYSCQDQGDILVVPLLCSAGVIGIVVITLTGGPEGFEQMLLRLAILHANQFASTIYSSRLFSRLSHEKTAIKQKIVAQTQKLDSQIREIKNLWDIMPAGVVVIDIKTGNVVRCNDTALHILAFDTLEDTPYRKFINENVIRIFEAREYKPGGEICSGLFKKADGTPIEVEYCDQCVDTRGKKFILIIFYKKSRRVSSVSVTAGDTRDSDWSFADMEKIKIEKARVLGFLARRLSHDFSNVLNSISGFTHLINKFNNDPEKVNKYNITIGHAVKRGFELTTALKCLAIDRSFHVTELSLDDLLDDVIKQVHTLAGNGIKMDISKYKKPLFVYANIEDIKTAINKLTTHICRVVGKNPTDNLKKTIRITPREITVGKDIETSLIPHADVNDKYIEIGFSYFDESKFRKSPHTYFEPEVNVESSDKEGGLSLAAVLALILRYKGNIIVTEDGDSMVSVRVCLPAP